MINTGIKINYLFSKILTKVVGFIIKITLIFNKKAKQVKGFKEKYDTLFCDFFSRLDDGSEKAIHRDNCPICGCDERLFKFTVYKFPIVKCGRCSFIYREKTISHVTLGRWRMKWTDLYYKSRGMEHKIDECDYQNQVDGRARKLKGAFERADFDPRGKRFLDIGCSIGTACVAANSLGMRAVGVDIDPGRGHFQTVFERYKSDFTFIDGDFTQLKLEPRSFDFIMSTMTLDHVVDIKGFIEKVSVLLRKGGSFLVSVPNLDSMSNAVLKERYARQWMITHENFFDLPHLTTLLDTYNLKIYKTWTAWHPFLTIVRNPMELTIFKEFTGKGKRDVSRTGESNKKEKVQKRSGKDLFRRCMQGEILYAVASTK